MNPEELTPEQNLKSYVPNSLTGFSYDYLEKRARALKGEDIETLREQLYQIKSSAIKNLQEFKKQAIENLKINGIEIFEAKDKKETQELLERLIRRKSLVVKSKSNILNELEIKKISEKNEWELTETDLGDFLASLLNEGVEHPVLPALGISLGKVQQVLNEKLNIVTDKSPEAVVKAVSLLLRNKILKADVGLTGANAITSSGEIVILENEGNISLVSRIPKIHVVVAGIEKIVPELKSAMHVCRCAAIWGTGQKLTSYINIISGPSKTADIENRLVIGAQGAKKVYLILVDDWRSSFIGGDFEQMLYCINCGACLNTCPVFLSSSSEVIHTLDPASCFNCATCASCTLNCPAKIDWQNLMRNARLKFVKEGKFPEAFKEMIQNIRESGNPFGKIEKGEIPKALYCC